MTATLPHDLFGLIAMVFLLGLRHGMDPDHLATIDGLARGGALHRPGAARWSGCFFSLGHGAVVTLVAGVIAGTLHEGGAPDWLERSGAWISIAILLVLGTSNLVAVLRTPEDQVVRTAGVKARWLGRFTASGHPAVAATIGAAFAVSFDTVSQAALFSLTGAHLGGWPLSAGLGLVFTLGMMTTDGVNGLWVARMLARADRRARVASRVMGLAIGFLGFAIAGLGAARLVSAQAAAALEGAGLALGVGVAMIVAASFALAMRLARPDAPRAG
jgi:high-affinity nickel-transport protein